MNQALVLRIRLQPTSVRATSRLGWVGLGLGLGLGLEQGLGLGYLAGVR